MQRRGDEGSNRGLDQTEEGNDDDDDDATTTTRTTTTMNDDADDGERRKTWRRTNMHSHELRARHMALKTAAGAVAGQLGDRLMHTRDHGHSKVSPPST